jgi:hypothetical protein
MIHTVGIAELRKGNLFLIFDYKKEERVIGKKWESSSKKPKLNDIV